MELWFIITVSLCVASLLKSVVTLLSPETKNKLPPGPPAIPLIGNLIWLRKPVSQMKQVFRRLKPRYGPIITINIAQRSLVFVSGHSIAHQALVQNGALFADRPAPPPTSTYLNAHKTISASSYSPTWRLLRRNITHEILHLSRVRGYAPSRRWVLSVLMDRLRGAAQSESSVRLIDHFQYAMLCLLVLMCFGDKLQENQIREIETIQRKLLLSFKKFTVLNYWKNRTTLEGAARAPRRTGQNLHTCNQSSDRFQKKAKHKRSKRRSSSLPDEKRNFVKTERVICV